MRQDCNAILDAGIRDRTIFSSSSEVQEFVRKVLSLDYESFVQERSESGGGGAFELFNVLTMSGGGESEKERFESLKSAFEDNSERFFKSSAMESLYREVVNESVVKAWLECQRGTQEVLGYYTGDPQDRFTVVVARRADEKSDKPLKIRDVTANYSEPAGEGSLRGGGQIDTNDVLTRRFTRKHPSKPDTVTVTFRGTTQAVRLDLPTGDAEEAVDVTASRLDGLAKRVEALEQQLGEYRVKDVRVFVESVRIQTNLNRTVNNVRFPEPVDFAAIESLTAHEPVGVQCELVRRDNQNFEVVIKGALANGVQWLPMVRVVGIRLLR